MPDPSCSTLEAPASITEFFDSYWKALARKNWDAVVLHSWQDLPEKIDSDIDYAVRGPQARQLLEFLADYARSQGWRLVQVIEHEPKAYFCVCVQGQAPFSHLQLDVTWNYSRIGHKLLGADLLFKNKRVVSGKSFQVPSPGAEFAYRLAKAAAKNKMFSDIQGDLAKLLDEDAADCHRVAQQVFGSVPAYVADSTSTISAWAEWYRDAPFFEGIRKGRRFGLAEFRLYFKRILHPTGFLLTRVNEDLVQQITDILIPAFRRTKIQNNLGIFGRVKILAQLIRTTLVIQTSNIGNSQASSAHSYGANARIAEVIETLAIRAERRIRNY